MRERKNMYNIKQTKLSYIIKIPRIADEAYLCFAEGRRQIPFKIKRFYFIYDVENNAVRGKHAHKKTVQMIFCLKGKVQLILDNGIEKENIILKKPSHGLLVNKMIWHDMAKFEKDTILLVVASEYFDEADYIRNYDQFQQIAMGQKKNLLIKLIEFFKSKEPVYTTR